MKPLTFLSALSAAALGGSLLTAQILAGTAQTHRDPQFENDAVKVWKTTVLPKQPLAMHHHDHPRVLIALTGGTMNIVDPAGNTEVHPWEAGKAYWLPAMPPNTLHSDINAGDKPLEVMVVELEKENWAPPK
jgi:quercetin dioxygenase-like cupin family protein